MDIIELLKLLNTNLNSITVNLNLKKDWWDIVSSAGPTVVACIALITSYKANKNMIKAQSEVMTKQNNVSRLNERHDMMRGVFQKYKSSVLELTTLLYKKSFLLVKFTGLNLVEINSEVSDISVDVVKVQANSNNYGAELNILLKKCSPEHERNEAIECINKIQLSVENMMDTSQKSANLAKSNTEVHQLLQEAMNLIDNLIELERSSFMDNK